MQNSDEHCVCRYLRQPGINSAKLVPAKRRYSKALHAVYTPKLVPR